MKRLAAALCLLFAVACNDKAARRDLASYSPCPRDGTACKIMPLGDSITFGLGSSTGGGYRTTLFHRAHAAAKNITFVGSQSAGPATVDGVAFPGHHEGYSGYMIKTGGDRMGIYERTATAIHTYSPHIITLMIGTNDIVSNFDIARAPSRFGDLLDLIFATDPTIFVVVAKITPTKFDSENALITAYNDGVAAVVAARRHAGKHIVLVDMYGAFIIDANYKTDYLYDDLHPNDAGYVVMGDTWFDRAIAQLLP